MAVREFTVGTYPQSVWGWLVSLDFFVAGTGSGLFIISLLLGYMLGMGIGLFLVLMGGGILLVDLTRPINAWRAIMRPHTSWLSRGTISIIVFAIFSIFHIIYISSNFGGGLVSNIAWQNIPMWEKIVAIISGLTATFVALYPGFLLGSMRGIPLWNSVLSPLLFLSSALIAGVGVMLLLPISESLIAVQVVGIVFIPLQLLLLLSLIFTSQVEATKTAVMRLTRGDFKLQFYIAVLLFGLIVPLLFFLLSISIMGYTILPEISGILLLIGQFMLRYGIVKVGTYFSPV